MTDVPSYIAAAPPRARPMLRELRRLVRRAAPEADERISYKMPYYHLGGRFAYFAAFTNHVSFYIMGRTATTLAKETAKWRSTRNTMRFDFGTKLPVALIARVLKDRKRDLEAK